MPTKRPKGILNARWGTGFKMDMPRHIVWEKALKPGDLVEARWTEKRLKYVVQAVVKEVYGTRAVVEFVDVYSQGKDLSFARELTVPTSADPRWSKNNGLFPLVAGSVRAELPAGPGI